MGSLTLRRYVVQGVVPQDFAQTVEKNVRAHAFLPIAQDGNEEKSVGFCSVMDENDLDLAVQKFFFDGRILLSLRQDTLKPPAAHLRRLLRERTQTLEKERGQPLSAAALRDLKAILAAELRKNTLPKTRTVDLVWELQTQRLLFFSHAKSMNEALLTLFSQTFNVGLDLEGPAVWARQCLAENSKEAAKLPSLKPTPEFLSGFAGLRPIPHAEQETISLAAALAGELGA